MLGKCKGENLQLDTLSKVMHTDNIYMKPKTTFI